VHHNSATYTIQQVQKKTQEYFKKISIFICGATSGDSESLVFLVRSDCRAIFPQRVGSGVMQQCKMHRLRAETRKALLSSCAPTVAQ